MRRQQAGQFECTCGGPAFQDEQNLGVFHGLLRTLFTTKREFIIAFKDHHLRASLFIRVEPGYFFGDLALHDIADVRRMVAFSLLLTVKFS